MKERETLHEVFSKKIKLKEKLLLAMDNKCSVVVTAEVMREYYSLEFPSLKTAVCFVESFFESPVYWIKSDRFVAQQPLNQLSVAKSIWSGLFTSSLLSDFYWMLIALLQLFKGTFNFNSKPYEKSIRQQF